MSGLRVLVVGSGAREHALAWRLATEDGVARVLVAPGNPLMAPVADVRPDVRTDDFDGIVALHRAERIDLVVVGPEAPLVAGLADRLASEGVACFGPSAAAAQLEGSKAFAREICRAAVVPMAMGRAFASARGAIEYAAEIGLPLVVKADGLAGGKGVTICATLGEAERAIREALEDGRFGAAGASVVVERFLTGREASVIAICDGTTALALPAARDHKQLHEGDRGPNTGGMGAYSPLPDLADTRLQEIVGQVFEPVLAHMASRGTPFRGALFAGLILTADGPRVLEFNVRLGDPETQAILPRLPGPLAPVLLAAATGSLMGLPPISTMADSTVALTLAAAGYPTAPRTGDEIRGIDDARAARALVFGAGVARDDQGVLVTAGGRVLTVVGRGSDLAEAADAAYEAAARIDFAGKIVRRDIGRVAAELAA
ncbi:MAG: phosphoribosylamine--glycine ligase [Chloroflexota bacterium]|nr:phosphoribosylamine--glycine ligase [Chloroflexota bacterium]